MHEGLPKMIARLCVALVALCCTSFLGGPSYSMLPYYESSGVGPRGASAEGKFLIDDQHEHYHVHGDSISHGHGHEVLDKQQRHVHDHQHGTADEGRRPKNSSP